MVKMVKKMNVMKPMMKRIKVKMPVIEEMEDKYRANRKGKKKSHYGK